MVRLHLHRICCGSWACPRCARVLGRALCDRLQTGEANLKLLGLQFVLLTLTFDPKRFESPRAALEAAKRGRWVAECLRKWQVRRGLHVEYLSKWELHESGWPHVHVLLVTPVGLRWKNPRVEGGEFDEFWLHGFSNVQWESKGGLAAYGSKLAAYATKEAGGDGCDALDASGLPASGFHWVQPSRGFWKLLGVSPVDNRYVGEWGDQSMRDDAGKPSAVTVKPRRQRWGSHADRVRSCGWSSALVVEGGMRDERPKEDGGHGGTFTIELPCKRSALGTALQEYFGRYASGTVEYDGEEPPDDMPGYGIVAGVRDVVPKELVEFLEQLPADLAADVDVAEVRHRLGWLNDRWPAELDEVLS